VGILLRQQLKIGLQLPDNAWRLAGQVAQLRPDQRKQAKQEANKHAEENQENPNNGNRLRHAQLVELGDQTLQNKGHNQRGNGRRKHGTEPDNKNGSCHQYQEQDDRFFIREVFVRETA
jgi:hypothetical protein